MSVKPDSNKHSQAAEPPSALVLTEEEAIELLAFLVTAARIQVEESREYGPLRLLTAAERLSKFIVQRVSPDTQRFLDDLLRDIPQTLLSMSDADGYLAGLDALSRAVAQQIVASTGSGTRPE